MTPTEVVVALVLVVGMVGIVVQVIPGSLLIGGALLVWAADTGGRTAWVVLAAALLVLVAGTVVKYVVPGRRLRTRGIPDRTLLVGLAGAVVGFFVVPVVGLVLGFVLGIYLAERLRVGGAAAWPSTKHALRAVGASILIELAAGSLAIAIWVAGLVLT